MVDDESLVREMLKRVLVNEGYQVSVEENGIGAIQHLQTHPVDVVLTDMVMPEMDGMGVIRYVQKELPNVATVAMTAHHEIRRDMAYGLGSITVVPKPFRLEQMLRAIEKQLPGGPRESSRGKSFVSNE